MARVMSKMLAGRQPGLMVAGLLGACLAGCGSSGKEAPEAPKVMPATTLGSTALSADFVGASVSAMCGCDGYSVINLGSGQATEIPVINANGQVALSLGTATGYVALFFDGETVRNIGTLGGDRAFATGLNDAGEVAGYAGFDASGSGRAFRWSAKGGMHDLGTLYDFPLAKGLAINKKGQVAGYIEASLEGLRAVMWDKRYGATDLGKLAPGFLSGAVAQGINDSGAITGFSSAADDHDHAFLWTRHGMTDLGTLAGIDSYATVINNAGQVAGYAAASSAYNYHGFVWTKALGMVDLGTLGGPGSGVWAINASGQIAGVSDVPSGYQHALSWTRATGMIDLGTLGGPSSSAIAVNSKGQMVGWSTLSGAEGHYSAFLTTAGRPMVNLDGRIPNAPAGLELTAAMAISDKGAIVADSNAGMVLLVPGKKGTDAPVVGPLLVGDLLPLGAAVAVSVNFRDQNPGNTHTATWAWADGCAAAAGTVSEVKGIGSASVSHTFCATGVFPLSVTVTDNTGRSTTVTRSVTVYDPASPIVAGSGWFVSPSGASPKDRLAGSQATFSFATVRTGLQLTVRFHVANLDFQGSADGVQSMSGKYAQYQGIGRLNGAPGYRFLLAATDATGSIPSAADRLRIRISHTDARTKADVVDYDNRVASPPKNGGISKAQTDGGEGSGIAGGGITIRQ